MSSTTTLKTKHEKTRFLIFKFAWAKDEWAKDECPQMDWGMIYKLS